MPICPNCKSSRLFQKGDPWRFDCIDCKTEFKLRKASKTVNPFIEVMQC